MSPHRAPLALALAALLVLAACPAVVPPTVSEPASGPTAAPSAASAATGTPTASVAPTASAAATANPSALFSGPRHVTTAAEQAYCAAQTGGACPAPQCEIVCCPGSPGNPAQGCAPCCTANRVDCADFDAASCPTADCRVLTTCQGKKVCDRNPVNAPVRSCGEAGYYGQDLACCTGLVARCGYEFSDHTCKPLSSDSGYAMCVPCGNKVCDPGETHCNCPEDCK